MNINQKVVIVTGSGGGIGEGIAKHFAAHGAKVLVNDIQAAAGHKVVQKNSSGWWHCRLFCCRRHTL